MMIGLQSQGSDVLGYTLPRPSRVLVLKCPMTSDDDVRPISDAIHYRPVTTGDGRGGRRWQAGIPPMAFQKRNQRKARRAQRRKS